MSYIALALQAQTLYLKQTMVPLMWRDLNFGSIYSLFVKEIQGKGFSKAHPGG